MTKDEVMMQQIRELLHTWGEDDTQTLESIRQYTGGVIFIDSISFGGCFITDLDKHGYVCRIEASDNKKGLVTLRISR